MSLGQACGGTYNLTNRTQCLPYVLLIKYFCHYLQDADTDENQGSLGFEEFCSFYKMISTRRDLYLIMISYSNQKEVMDIHDLAHFLENEQKVVENVLRQVIHVMWKNHITRIHSHNIYILCIPLLTVALNGGEVCYFDNHRRQHMCVCL